MEQQKPHASASETYPVAQRGHRILWRTVTIGLFALLATGAWWLADTQEWNFKLTLAAVAVPYWSVVMAVWLRYGPYMPRLHGQR